MSHTKQLQHRQTELQHRWDGLRQNIDTFRQDLVAETRSDEKLRLSRVISKLEAEQDTVVQELEDVERSIEAFLQQPKLTRAIQDWYAWLTDHPARAAGSTAGILLLGLTVFISFELPPFQPRPVWHAEALAAPNALALHNSGTTLAVGAANKESGCVHPHKGLWYRPLNVEDDWYESNVDAEHLCIDSWDPDPALSDIVALSSMPNEPDIIYALTSHSGLLVSTDAGYNFTPHPATDSLEDLEADYWPKSLFITGSQSTPVFWIASANMGLLAYRDNRWLQVDGGGDDGCTGLPTLDSPVLLVTDRVLLIGSDQQGLWVSDDGGRTCRQVFDAVGRYEFGGLWNVSPTSHARYLALVYDWKSEPRDEQAGWQLRTLCPISTTCNQTEWQADPNPVWQDPTWLKPPVDDVLVQRTSVGSYEWYLVTEAGQIWHGDMLGNPPQQLLGITRCYNIFRLCNARFAPAAPDAYPYLLAAGRFYKFTEGAWWRQYWP